MSKDISIYLSKLKNSFYKKTQIPDINGCMLWNAAKNCQGYGKLRATYGLTFQAHRFSYYLHNGNISDDLYVCHTCDNPSCVAPNHLFLGNGKENQQDSKKKGRMKKSEKIGEKNSHVKLKEDDVFEIRRKLNDGISITALSKEFNVTYHCIPSIKNNKSWIHLLR